MSAPNLTLYGLLIRFGASAEEAEAAVTFNATGARASDVAALGLELRREMAELKLSIVLWNVGIFALTALVLAIVWLT